MRWHKTEKLQAAVDGLWTSQDVCDHFGITPMTLYEWRRNRGFPAVILRGKAANVRFVKDDVEKWKKANLDWLQSKSVLRPQPSRPAAADAA